jgi:hypothetical protein
VPHSSSFDGPRPTILVRRWRVANGLLATLEQNLPLCVKRNLLLTGFHRDGIAPRIIYGSDSVSGI